MTDSVFELDLDELFAEEGYVRRLARGLLLDDHAVDDVVQQTWEAALRNPPRERAATRGWLATVVRRLVSNRARSEMRRRRREQEVAVADSSASIDEVLLREERRREIVEVLDALDEPYRTLVALRYLEGLEPVEIARRQGVPAATVRTQVRRGLEQMRQRLDASHGDRMLWCTALVPIARGRKAAAVSGSAVTGGVYKALVAAALLFVAWAVWPPTETAPPANDPSAQTVASTGTETAADNAPAVREPQSEVLSPNTRPAAYLAGAIRGRFVRPDGEPLQGARIEAFAFDGTRLFGGDGFLPEAEATTAADGSFVLRGLPVQARCIAVADVGGDLQQLVPLPVSPTHEKVLDAGDFPLEPRAVVTGTVLDEEEQPVVGAEVFTADLPGLVLAAFPIDRFVPAHGAVVMVPQPKPSEAGKRTADWYDQLAPHLAWRVAKTDYGELPNEAFVPVVLDGSPLQSLLHRLPFARAKTAADGSFRLGGVVPGKNVLVARAAGLGTVVRSGCTVRADKRGDVGVLTLAAGNELAGRVLDANGEPVAGACVRVAPIALFGFRGVAPCEPEVRTAADGTFRVAGLGRGKAVVAFRQNARAPWQIAGPVATDDDVDLTFRAPVATLVQVQGVHAEALAGLRIEARPAAPLGEMSRLGMAEEFAPVAIEATDVEGQYRLMLEPGVWTLRGTLPGHASRTHLVVAPAQDPVVFAMTPLASVDVQVVDVGGNPCPGVEVFVQSVGDPDDRSAMLTSFKLARFDEPWPCQRHTTDERGRVRIAVRQGPVRLSAQGGASGCGELTKEFAGSMHATLQLRGVGGVFGGVDVGDSMGTDPRAYRVVVDHIGADAGGPIAASATVRPGIDGSFRCGQLPPGRYRIALCEPLPASLSFGVAIQWLDDHSSPFFRPDEIQKFDVEIVAGSDTRVDFAIGGLDGELGGVSGVVTVDGKPAVGAKVWRRARERFGQGYIDSGNEDRPRATLAKDGSFVVDDLEPGTHWLNVYDGTSKRLLHVFEVDVESATRTPVRADVVLGTAVAFVLHPDGTPAVGEHVMLREVRADGEELVSYREKTDAAGKVLFRDVPTGDYRFSVYGRHLHVEGEAMAVVAGDRARPHKLVGKTIHRVRLDLLDTVPKGSVMYCMRRVGSHAWNSHLTQKRTAEFGLLQPGEYEIRLRIDGVYYEGVPARVLVSDKQHAVRVGQGAKRDG